MSAGDVVAVVITACICSTILAVAVDELLDYLHRRWRWWRWWR